MNDEEHAEWIDTPTAAALICIRPNTLRRWRMDGRGPKFYRMPGAKPKTGHVRYRRSEVLDWLDNLAPGSTE